MGDVFKSADYAREALRNKLVVSRFAAANESLLQATTTAWRALHPPLLVGDRVLTMEEATRMIADALAARADKPRPTE